ncbi:MAG: leucine--tRNA ligase [bacterium]|nr:leucine--tRNA ligase [bacterium]
MSKDYDPKEIEAKWQKEWEKSGLYKTKESSDKPKYYILDMFPYVSGEGIHVGHPKGYIATDIVSRMKRMQGFNVLHPMGFDAFGLPAENYAIKTKTNPVVSVAKNIEHFKKQLEAIGFDYDWSREISTSDPKFYKWTQWIFLKLLEKGLAYESSEPVNWCPVDKTVLANEDVEDGKCERCGSIVEKRPIRQWVLKITDYADRLLEDLEDLDWPKSIKESQKNWIGRSYGMLFSSPVKDTDIVIETFSAHFEAFKADTFVVIAPDHKLLPKLVAGLPNEEEILNEAKEMVNKRILLGREEIPEVEGIFTGRYTIDPVGNGELPIWIANYALADYGTGIVKCSAHDERDFRFAKKYGINLKAVLFPEDPELRKKVENLDVCYVDMKNGILTEPEEFLGKKDGEIRAEIIEYLEKNGLAKRKTTYKLHDWVFSRQRYWGEPIPVLRDGDKVIPLSEEELPLILPAVESYEPTGTAESPLANIPEWINVKVGDKLLRRESNTMPQWAGSSWYYLRYMDPNNDKALVDKDREKYWNMVDLYVGGAEHATRHLIYARFWHKFLYDIGVVTTKEPFKRLQHVGLIIAEDGRKMSKRWGNIINPDDIISNYGADTLRMYEMFMGPFDQSVSWNSDSLIGIRRFLERVWKLKDKLTANSLQLTASEPLMHQTIKKVSEDIEAMKFNTAVSTLMIYSNALTVEEEIPREDYETLLKLLAPFAPHMTEELWKELGHTSSIHTEAWPQYDEKRLVSETVTIVVQVNGKVRGKFSASPNILESDAVNQAENLPEIQKWVGDKVVTRQVYVPGKIVNFIISL